MRRGYRGPEIPDTTEFFRELKIIRDVKPEWMGDDILETVLEKILDDVKLGRFKEIDRHLVKVPSMPSFGIV